MSIPSRSPVADGLSVFARSTFAMGRPEAPDRAVAVAAERPVLRLHGFSAGFVMAGGPVTVVDGLDLELRRGEITALVGESGSGKSVACQSLVGLNGAWRQGRAEFDGIDLVASSERELSRLRGRRIAMIHQHPTACLDPVMSIGRHLVGTLARTCGLRGTAARAAAMALLREVGMPEPEARLRQFPHELSGGMNQRVMIALALSGRPALLIADEPTTALDVTVQARILRLLRRLVGERGLALLFITHDLGIVAELADRVAVLYAGRLAEVGATDQVLNRPRHPYTALLLRARPRLDTGLTRIAAGGEVPGPGRRPAGCAFVPRCASADAACHRRPPLDVFGGRAVACWHPLDGGLHGSSTAAAAPRARAAPEDARPIIDATGLSKHFPLGSRRPFGRRATLRAVDGVTFSLHRGGSLGLVGESGCGKSTIARLVAGLARPSAGALIVDGAPAPSRSGLRAHSRRVQMMFQNPLGSLDPRMTVGEQVAEPLRVHRLARPRECRERARGALAALGLGTDVAGAYPGQLSGGQLQRVVIARALILDPPLLVCDEPTSSLDVSVQAEVVDLLNRTRERRDLSHLFISHDLAVVRSVADDIAVMYRGRLVEVGPAATVLRHPAHPYTRALIAAVPGERDGSRPADVGAVFTEPAPSGCAYAPRCPLVRPRCREVAPDGKPMADGRLVACHVAHGDA